MRFLLVLACSINLSVFSQWTGGSTCADSLHVPHSFCISCGSSIYSIPIPCQPDQFKFSVYNSKKVLVYRSEDPHFKWDGKDTKGITVLSGTYVWHLDLVINHRVYSKKGFLNIL